VALSFGNQTPGVSAQPWRAPLIQTRIKTRRAPRHRDRNELASLVFATPDLN